MTNKVDYLKDKGISHLPLYGSANRHLDYLEKHNRTESTILTYASCYRTLIRTIADKLGENTQLKDIEDDDIPIIARGLDCKESVVRWKISVLGAWIEYETGHNPVKGCKLLWNRHDVRRRFITRAQFESIYDNCRNDMERCVLLLGAQLGMRREEMTRIELGDIQDRTIMIRGKGHGSIGKTVVKTIPDKLKRMIDAYIDGERRIISDSSGSESCMLLLQGKHNRHPGEPISICTIDKMCQRLSKESGIRFSTHDLRRLYCMTLAKECGLESDIDTLRRMMRHESPETTLLCYIDADLGKMSDAERKLNELFEEL